MFAWKSLLSFYLVAIVALAYSSSAKGDDVFSYLKEKYDEMPEKGRFAAGAVVGFVGSRVAIKSAVSVIKVAGAAYIAYVKLNSRKIRVGS